MRLLRVLVPMMVAVVGIVGQEGTASSAPLVKQNFTLTSEDPEEPGGTVVASGAINAVGEDVVISDTEDQFVFPDGTLTIIHAPVRSKEHFNEHTCTASFKETGTYVISEGTGQYEGVTGSGTYRVAGRFQSDCESEPTGSFTITARGSINLPDA
jgi:hypothetical protein